MNTNRAALNLEIPLIKLISASLGLGKEQVKTLGLTNLSHICVSESKDISTPVLWETVIVSNFTFRVDERSDTHVSGEVPVAQLIPSAVGNIHLGVTNLASGQHFAQADHPLVVAIRVMQPIQKTKERRSPLDLSNTGIDKQTGALGYEVTLQNGVDPLKKEAAMRIDNPNIPQFKGELYTFQHSEPWVSPARRVIAGDDPEARSGSYVWDKLAIQWNEDLSRCKLVVTRQYSKFVPMKSGLPGTR